MMVIYQQVRKRLEQRGDPAARRLAENEGVEIRTYDIIYKMIHPEKEKRAVVFSELIGEVLYN